MEMNWSSATRRDCGSSYQPMKNSTEHPGRLVLEDGTVHLGVAFGAPATRVGEVAFNTAMSGYQEVISDPSYRGQIVVMTCAQIGNYGVNDDDGESRGPQVEGFVVRELSRVASNYRSRQSLDDWLAAAGIPGIADIDTRALTQKLRSGGALRGAISTEDISDAELLERCRAWPGLVGVDLVTAFAPKEACEWTQGVDDSIERPKSENRKPKETRHVVVLDCGVKRNILRQLFGKGCRVTVVPPTLDAAAVLDRRPDGVLVSNGPGDPEPLAGVIRTVRDLAGRVPIFGICLGHQLLALALGGRTFKLKFGHRGANQPVRNLATGRVEITSQNHGFAVDPDSLTGTGLEPTHVNLSDGTLEGFRHASEPIFAVQYHPEAAPGPHDATYLFDDFIEMMATGRAPHTVGNSSA